MTFIRSTQLIRTLLSPSRGKCVRIQITGEIARYARSCTPVLPVTGENSEFDWNTQQPRAHQALGVGDELPTEICFILLLDDRYSPSNHLDCSGMLQTRYSLYCAQSLLAFPWQYQ